jgi:hypothetical protein
LTPGFQRSSTRSSLAAATRVVEAMSSIRRVPKTRLLDEDELSADHASGAAPLRGWRLLRDAFLRFRSGDGFRQSTRRHQMDYLVLAGLDPNLSSTNSIQAHWVDVDHQPTDLAVGFEFFAARAIRISPVSWRGSGP